MLQVIVSADDFDVSALNSVLAIDDPGAIASFVGLVRRGEGESAIDAMLLEHYPGMTEKSLQKIAGIASQRWPLKAVCIHHRVGLLLPGAQIVYVGVASRHRHAALDACSFIMDYLKTGAPFWKKEMRNGVGHWVDARDSDHQALERWKNPS